MTYEKDPFEFEEIPDFALQPAKEADEYSFHYIPRGANSRFDPAAYERVLHESARQAAEKEEPEIFQESTEELLPVILDDTELETITAEMTEVSAAEEVPDAGVEVVAEEMADAAVTAAAEEMPVAEIEAAESEEIIEAASQEDPIAKIIEASSEEAVSEETMEVSSVEESTFEEMPEYKNTIPIFAAAREKRPANQPVFVAKTAPAKIIPMVGSLVSSKLKLVDMKQRAPLRITIEEDILVPDVKPDLARILAMDGKIKLSEKEIHSGQAGTDTVRILGDLILQTLYVPEQTADGEPIVSIESKIPFKNEMEMKAGPNSDLVLAPSVESVDFSVVNERKFRVRATVAFGIKEYSNVDIEVFEGLRDEEVQMLKEKINLTDVAMRKTETIEIKDELSLKETSPEVLKILKYDVNVVENHKQITKEKAVINASVYCNILYLGADGNTDTTKAEEAGSASEEGIPMPVLYQGKTEFTQFIRLDEEYNPNDQNPAGSKVNFNIASLNLTAKEDGNGKRNLFELDMNVDTRLELYKNIVKEVVTDVYHHRKDVQFETDEIGVMALGGSGAAEISAREIINIPERYGNVDKVAYISGNIMEKRSFIDQAKSVVEGVVTVNLICNLCRREKNSASISHRKFHSEVSMEIPGTTPDMIAES